ncbi:transposase [Sphaerospermopsis aphanizomenoides BCCUSP55]|uniref:zinc ribbon domain-containing protein n=1 Tax=Sphaerospermopsis aphanizomenoides TaxID=459663 RepID=UPI0019059E7A|nr:transposase [Sphaerospermopsis aphanizomenoides BCCUSP55]
MNYTVSQKPRCDSCGFECDRDLNAAINLSQCSLGVYPSRGGSPVLGVSPRRNCRQLACHQLSVRQY